MGCVETIDLAGEGERARGGESNDIGNGRALALSNTGWDEEIRVLLWLNAAVSSRNERMLVLFDFSKGRARGRVVVGWRDLDLPLSAILSEAPKLSSSMSSRLSKMGELRRGGGSKFSKRDVTEAVIDFALVTAGALPLLALKNPSMVFEGPDGSVGLGLGLVGCEATRGLG